jgi:1,4-dihydroxy-6-naphthoate synthase
LKGQLLSPVNGQQHIYFSGTFTGIIKQNFHRFNELENLVLDDKALAAVIIHENRFTYAVKGWSKWKTSEIRGNMKRACRSRGWHLWFKKIRATLIAKLEDLIRQSIFFARHNTAAVMNYVREYSQEMEDWVMRSHIDLYVNDFSVDLGPSGIRP